MKKHILNNFSKTYNYSSHGSDFYYDELTQVSYIDKDYKVKVMSKYDSSKITETVETSDTDEFSMNSTIETSTIEDSDPDEFNFFGSSIETRVIENSDPDEFYIN